MTLKVPAHVHVERAAREVMALKQPQSGEVEDAVGPFKRGIEHVGLEDVAADIEQPDPRIGQRRGQILVPAANEIVVDDDLSNILLEEAVDGVRADQPGTADHD